jgi:drug/metabolite transporter (DMT)-like permease
MRSRIGSRTQADLSMLVVSFIWGATFVIVKNALLDIGPFMFVGIRFILAFLVLATLAYREVIKIRWSTLAAGLVLGVFLFVGYTFQTLGLQYTTSSNAGFVTGVSVVLVPLVYALLHRRRPSLFTAAIVIMATVGLYLISVPVGSLTLTHGDLLVLVGAVGFALHIIYVDYYTHDHNAVALTSLQILVVGIVSLSIALKVESWPDRFALPVILALIITAVFATALAFLLQNYMQRFSTPTDFAIVLSTEPVFAALAGYLWAGERMTNRGFLGAGLILTAMLLAVLVKKWR